MAYRQVGGFQVDSLATFVRYPRAPRPAGKYPVFLLHGAGSAAQYESQVFPSAVKLASVLARGTLESGWLGVPCASHNFGADAWGNAASRTNLTNLHAYVAAQIPTASSTGRVDFGISMGGAFALLDAINNPTKVKALAACIPVVNINSLYQQNPGGPIVGGFTASIATAWGKTYRTITDAVFNGTNQIASATGFTAADVGRYVVTNAAVRQSYGTPKVPFGTTITAQAGGTATMSNAATVSSAGNAVGFADPLPAGADILAQAAALAGIPVKLFYSSVDQYVDPADVTALATAIGASAQAVQIDTTFGHANGTLALVEAWNGGANFSKLVEWMVTQGA